MNEGRCSVLYSPIKFQNLTADRHVINRPMSQILYGPDAVGVSVILFCHTSINTAQFGKIRGAKSLVCRDRSHDYFTCLANIALQSFMRQANEKYDCFLILFPFSGTKSCTDDRATFHREAPH